MSLSPSPFPPSVCGHQPRTLPIQTSNPASASRNPRLWKAPLLTQLALQSSRACCSSTAGLPDAGLATLPSWRRNELSSACCPSGRSASLCANGVPQAVRQIVRLLEPQHGGAAGCRSALLEQGVPVIGRCLAASNPPAPRSCRAVCGRAAECSRPSSSQSEPPAGTPPAPPALQPRRHSLSAAASAPPRTAGPAHFSGVTWSSGQVPGPPCIVPSASTSRPSRSRALSQASPARPCVGAIVCRLWNAVSAVVVRSVASSGSRRRGGARRLLAAGRHPARGCATGIVLSPHAKDTVALTKGTSPSQRAGGASETFSWALKQRVRMQ